MPKISTIIIMATILSLLYSIIRRSLNAKKLASQGPQALEYGPYQVSFWERLLQIFLVFCTAAYALWVLGIKKFIYEELAKGGDLRPLIITLIMSIAFIAGLYFYYIYANREQLKAAESKRSPKQRYLGYLKIVAVWAFFIIVDLFVLK